jgi:hypothetical protein
MNKSIALILLVSSLNVFSMDVHEFMNRSLEIELESRDIMSKIENAQVGKTDVLKEMSNLIEVQKKYDSLLAKNSEYIHYIK